MSLNNLIQAAILSALVLLISGMFYFLKIYTFIKRDY